MNVKECLKAVGGPGRHFNLTPLRIEVVGGPPDAFGEVIWKWKALWPKGMPTTTTGEFYGGDWANIVVARLVRRAVGIGGRSRKKVEIFRPMYPEDRKWSF